MISRPPANMPAVLCRACGQFDRRRIRQRNKRAQLPEDLWQKAVALARKHELNKTARALSMKYRWLKKHLEATATDPSPS